MRCCSPSLPSLRIAREPLSGEPGEIAAPARVALFAQLAQIRPSIKAGRVAVIEDDPHRVIAYGLEPADADVSLARDRYLLAWTVTLDLGARALDSELLGGEGKGLATRIADHQGAALIL